MDIIHGPTAHHYVRFDDVVTEDNTQCFVFFDSTSDVAQVVVLLVVADIPTQRKLPVSGPEVP